MEPSWYEDHKASNTPLALWQTNMINIADDSPLVNFEEYRVDFDSAAPDVVTDFNNVIVPNSSVELTEEKLHYLSGNVNPVTDDGNNGNDHFLTVLDIVLNFASNE